VLGSAARRVVGLLSAAGFAGVTATITQGRDFFGVVPKQQPDLFPPGHGRPQVGEKSPGARVVVLVGMVHLDLLAKEDSQ